MLIWLDAFCAKYPHIIEAFGALAPFFGTVFLAYIAYQQWQTNERKRRQELFEMRYEHLSLNTSEILNKRWELIKENDNYSQEDYKKDLKNMLNNLAKHIYYIKSKDFAKLSKYLIDGVNNCDNYLNLNKKDRENKLKTFLEENEKYNIKIAKLIEPYLRIEPEETIWDIIKNFIIATYEFLAPRWLQNFLSKTKTVILNLQRQCWRKMSLTVTECPWVFQNLKKNK